MEYDDRGKRAASRRPGQVRLDGQPVLSRIRAVDTGDRGCAQRFAAFLVPSPLTGEGRVGVKTRSRLVVRGVGKLQIVPGWIEEIQGAVVGRRPRNWSPVEEAQLLELHHG